MSKQNQPRVGAGDIVLKLGEADYILKPTLRAMQSISREFGGLQPASSRILAMDLEAITRVVTHGAGLTQRGADGLAEKLWRAGLDIGTGGVCQTCFDYLQVLARGGRPAPTSTDESTDEEANHDSMDPRQSQPATSDSSTT